MDGHILTYRPELARCPLGFHLEPLELERFPLKLLESLDEAQAMLPFSRRALQGAHLEPTRNGEDVKGWDDIRRVPQRIRRS